MARTNDIITFRKTQSIQMLVHMPTLLTICFKHIQVDLF